MKEPSMVSPGVESETQTRGFGTTDFRSSTGGKSLAWMLGASLLLHSVLSPLPALVSLLSYFRPAESLEEERVNAIPLDLIEEFAEPVEAEPKPAVAPPHEELPATVEKEPDAPLPKEPEKPQVPKVPEPPAEEPAEKPTEGSIGDPVKLAGLTGGLVDSNANVRLILYSEAIRKSELGESIGELLRRTPQWDDFFGNSDIDPIRDLDNILVAGPQLRDSTNVVAVVQHHLAPEVVESAVDALVKRDGQWLPGKQKVARARADRAERIFAIRSKKLVAIAPLSAEKSARNFPTKGFGRAPKSVAMTAFIKTPHRVGSALPIRIPDSILWARALAREAKDGGVEIELEAEDASEEIASQDAHQLERMITAATQIDFSKLKGFASMGSLLFGKKTQKFVEKVEFTSNGKFIHGTLVLTQSQLRTVLGLLDGFLPPPRIKRPRVVPDPTAPSTTEAEIQPQNSATTNREPVPQPEKPEGSAPNEVAPTGSAPSP